MSARVHQVVSRKIANFQNERQPLDFSITVLKYHLNTENITNPD